MTTTPDLEGLPGAPLVQAGARDRRAGRITIAALVVALAESRLRELGIDVSTTVEWPSEREIALYEALRADANVPDPYYRYNSLRGELDGFLAALEARLARAA